MHAPTEQACLRTVMVRSTHEGATCSGFLVKHKLLDADGLTVSVVGPKSGLAPLETGDSLLVCIHSGAIVTATVTHIHREHDRYRAKLDATVLASAGIDVSATLETGQVTPGNAAHIDPLRASLKQIRDLHKTQPGA